MGTQSISRIVCCGIGWDADGRPALTGRMDAAYGGGLAAGQTLGKPWSRPTRCAQMPTIAIDSMEEDGSGLEGTLAA